jgi:hypothetical protein
MEGDKIVSFRKVKNINTAAWSFLKFDAGGTIPERLLVGSSGGLFDISGIEDGILVDQNVVGIKPQGRKYYIFELAGSSINKNKIYLGGNSMVILEYRNGKWYQDYEKDFAQEIRSIVEDNSGRLWLCTAYNGVKPVKMDCPGMIRIIFQSLTIKFISLPQQACIVLTMQRKNLNRIRLLVTGIPVERWKYSV